MTSQSIEKIRKKFHREWLLIAVDRLGPRTGAPLTGHLLAHSPNRDEIHDALLRRKRSTLVTYSDDELPAGYATAF